MLQRSYNNQTENRELEYLSNGFSLSLHNARYLGNISNSASFSIVFYGLDKDLVSLIRRDCATSYIIAVMLRGYPHLPATQTKRSSFRYEEKAYPFAVALRNFYICDTLDSRRKCHLLGHCRPNCFHFLHIP